MSKIALEMLTDIHKETVPFVPNYDDRLKEPGSVAGAVFPISWSTARWVSLSAWRPIFRLIIWAKSSTASIC